MLNLQRLVYVCLCVRLCVYQRLCVCVCMCVCYLDIPYFITTPKSFYQRLPMQNVAMHCVGVGEPPPTMTWRRVREYNLIHK